MGLIDVASVTTLLDSVASAKLIFDTAVGATGAEVNTVAKAAQNDLSTITAIGDNDVQADLAWWYRLRALNVLSSNLYTSLGVYNLWVALEKHLSGSNQDGVAGLDTFLRVNNVRVDPGCKAIGFPLSPEQLMPPVLDPMATYTVSGSGAGTFVHVADIDTTQYGRGWLEAVVTVGITGALTATITGLQWDGQTPTSKTITLTGHSVGQTVSIGTMGVQADSYDSVTGITITGGTAGNAFKIRSRVERTITATS